MKDLFIVTKFTMKDMLKRKSFLISTLIILIIIVIGFNVPNIIKSFNGEDTEAKLLIVDNDNIFEGNLEMLKNANLGYNIEIGKATFEEIKTKINNDEFAEALIIERKDNNVNIRYIVKNMAMIESVPENIVNAINSLYTNMQISKLGLTDEQIQSITPNFEFNIEQTEEEKVNGNIFAMMMMSLVLFYAIYFCEYQVSSSITTEKTSKIMETLVTSTSPRTIVLGKTIGIGIVGLVQIILMIVVAGISAKFCMDPELLNSIFDLSSITPKLVILTLVYFCFGYALYSLGFALTGSTVSKPEDVQYANGPINFIAVIGFYLAYFSMMNPSSNMNQIAGIVPIPTKGIKKPSA